MVVISGNLNLIRSTRIGLRITRKVKAFQKKYPGFGFRVEPIRIKPFSIDHVLLLVDVIQAVKQRFPGYRIINGELCNGNQGHNGLKPDAIFTDPNGHDRIALEIELGFRENSSSL